MNDVTWWTLIRSAGDGDGAAREEFARRYLPVVRATLASLGTLRPGEADLEDAVGEVLVECLKSRGILERAQRGRGAGFRALLHGACRNVVLRQRTRRARQRELGADSGVLGALPAEEEETLGRAFDRAWAIELLREAGEHQMRTAQGRGPEAVRRVEILRLRFHEELEVRQISVLLDLPPAFVHHEYAQARKEFQRSLQAVIAMHNPEDPEEAQRELRELLELFGAQGA